MKEVSVTPTNVCVFSCAGGIGTDPHRLPQRGEEVVARTVGGIAVDVDATPIAAEDLVPQREVGLPLAAAPARLARSWFPSVVDDVPPLVPGGCPFQPLVEHVVRHREHGASGLGTKRPARAHREPLCLQLGIDDEVVLAQQEVGRIVVGRLRPAVLATTLARESLLESASRPAVLSLGAVGGWLLDLLLCDLPGGGIVGD